MKFRVINIALHTVYLFAFTLLFYNSHNGNMLQFMFGNLSVAISFMAFENGDFKILKSPFDMSWLAGSVALLAFGLYTRYDINTIVTLTTNTMFSAAVAIYFISGYVQEQKTTDTMFRKRIDILPYLPSICKHPDVSLVEVLKDGLPFTGKLKQLKLGGDFLVNVAISNYDSSALNDCIHMEFELGNKILLVELNRVEHNVYGVTVVEDRLISITFKDGIITE